MPEPKHVGCPWCVKGHAPTFRWSGQQYEAEHVIQEKSADGLSTKVTVVLCTANQQQSK